MVVIEDEVIGKFSSKIGLSEFEIEVVLNEPLIVLTKWWLCWFSPGYGGNYFVG